MGVIAHSIHTSWEDYKYRKLTQTISKKNSSKQPLAEMIKAYKAGTFQAGFNWLEWKGLMKGFQFALINYLAERQSWALRLFNIYDRHLWRKKKRREYYSVWILTVKHSFQGSPC